MGGLYGRLSDKWHRHDNWLHTGCQILCTRNRESFESIRRRWARGRWRKRRCKPGSSTCSVSHTPAGGTVWYSLTGSQSFFSVPSVAFGVCRQRSGHELFWFTHQLSKQPILAHRLHFVTGIETFRGHIDRWGINCLRDGKLEGGS